MPRQNYDLIDTTDGKVLASVRYLWPEEPCDCCICNRPTLDHFAVPYYCGATRTGKSDGGYAPACRRCYDRWEVWDNAMEEYDSWLAVLAAGVAETGHQVIPPAGTDDPGTTKLDRRVAVQADQCITHCPFGCCSQSTAPGAPIRTSEIP
ncbi:MAG: hypothetical protein K0R58_31 [Ramlibacter sp.]|jgi:hypothetical protein|nr:hypothetical protein [Ramlibacter sp.]